ncbi:glycosyl hydrolase 115 family protein [Wenyingzhuangia sp. IMCC45467]
MKNILLGIILIPHLFYAQLYISNNKSPHNFPIVNSKQATTIYFDSKDDKVIHKTVSLLSSDIYTITGKTPKISTLNNSFNENLIIIGTIGKNTLIDDLINQKKLDVNLIKNKWEQFTIQTIKNPFPNVKQALVIAGSDKRGTAYGVFTLSKSMGVSPWYWWADVPVKKQKHIFINHINYTSKAPTVKYRGIFLNDEDWGLQPWASKKIDTNIKDIGPKTYEKIFELLLRLKGNMVAPAMHECTKAFYTIPGNMEMAEDYGIMITTSHCEPLLYNNASEWDKQKQGDWNYVTNKNEIIKALDTRIQQASNNDNIYTIALRGMHDEGMAGGSDEQKLKTLDEAIKDQRNILSKYIKKPITEVPQIFVPYKEVLGIYEKGLEVPEDITIVWPDDNYGYLKKLGTPDEQNRKGGTGVYYHISYLGWPNDYLWLNTTPPALMYAEMHKAYSLGANKYWLLNVGDIKPGEMGMQLFLDMAWDFDQFNFENINKYQVNQLSSIFGEEYKNDIEYILDRYYYHGFTRKPEYMTWDFRWNSLFAHEKVKDTEFSFINYNEAENRLKDYNDIANRAKTILNKLPEKFKASFYELIYYPVKGASLYNHEMLIGQKNRWYAKQKRAATNSLANDVILYHDSIASITKKYNNLLNGKWDGMMTAPGFLPTPQLSPTSKIELPKNSSMNVFVEGISTNDKTSLKLPEFNRVNNKSYFFELYNSGTTPFKWSAIPSEKWIKLNINKGNTKVQQRIEVSIDWDKVPTSKLAEGKINIHNNNRITEIKVIAIPQKKELNTGNFYTEDKGVISIIPTAYHRKKENGDIKFQTISGLGYSNSSLQLGNAKFNSGNKSYVAYDFYTSKAGNITIKTYMLPLFAKDKDHGTRYGVQVDDLNYIEHSNYVKEYSKNWANNIIRNSAINETTIYVDKAGKHTLKIYAVDPGMILQKIVIDTGGLKPSYLGPTSM